ncbi:substrate-binding domain-containing protein [Bacteroidales bacterium OttesenSCG-928-M11]|nr:substrate-binding domain-containing protein [Bacteroidales bacterium OttesenSCG-928-M11]
MLFGCCKDNSKDLSLSGVGLSQPFLDIVIPEYSEETDMKISYNIASSGMAVNLLQDYTLDFISIISLINKENFKKELVSIPVGIDAIVVLYNIDDSVQELKLDASLISRIYTGRISYWNDPDLVALNPSLKQVGKLPIIPFFRAETSGSSFLFSSYLNAFDLLWNKEMGVGRSLQWKTGIGVVGNENLINSVKKTKGAIGYGGFLQAMEEEANIAFVKNLAGYFTWPNHNAMASALGEIQDEQILGVVSTDTQAYPLTAFLWISLYKNQNYNNRSVHKKEALVKFLKYLVSPQVQRKAGAIGYLPLPEEIQEKSIEIANEIVYE